MSLFSDGNIPTRLAFTPSGPVIVVNDTDCGAEEVSLSARPSLDVMHFMSTPCEIRDCTFLDVVRTFATSEYEADISRSLFVSAGLREHVMARIMMAMVADPRNAPFDGDVVLFPPELDLDADCPVSTDYTLSGVHEDGTGRGISHTPLAELRGCSFVVRGSAPVMDYSVDDATCVGDLAVGRVNMVPTVAQVAEAIAYEMTWFGPVLPDGMSDTMVRGTPTDVWAQIARSR